MLAQLNKIMIILSSCCHYLINDQWHNKHVSLWDIHVLFKDTVLSHQQRFSPPFKRFAPPSPLIISSCQIVPQLVKKEHAQCNPYVSPTHLPSCGGRDKKGYGNVESYKSRFVKMCWCDERDWALLCKWSKLKLVKVVREFIIFLFSGEETCSTQRCDTSTLDTITATLWIKVRCKSICVFRKLQDGDVHLHRCWMKMAVCSNTHTQSNAPSQAPLITVMTSCRVAESLCSPSFISFFSSPWWAEPSLHHQQRHNVL